MKRLFRIGLFALGAGLFFGAAKGASLKKSGQLLSVTLKNLRNLKKTGAGIYGDLNFTVDLRVSNPSPDSFTIRIPVIKVFYGNKELGSTIPGNKTLSILPYADSNLDSIEFRIPIQQLYYTDLAKDMLTNLSNISAVIMPRLSFLAMVEINGILVEYKAPLT